MTINPNSANSGLSSPEPDNHSSSAPQPPAESLVSSNGATPLASAAQSTAGLSQPTGRSPQASVVSPTRIQTIGINAIHFSTPGLVLVAIAVMILGLVLQSIWLGLAGALVALVVCLWVLWVAAKPIVIDLVSPQQWTITICVIGTLIASWGLLKSVRGDELIQKVWGQVDWDAVGALGEVFGAVGQILIAVLAVYVAWRQYVIEKDLTLQQNLITQQQTIDSYFQGVSDLVLDDEGLLEDWPQERAIAEARTSAILSSVDAGGKAKIIRFLSRANLLSPLKRDQRLGRPILDGAGGYAEDRALGVRVIDLGVMLAGANVSNTDLRWTDLSEANLIRANLSRCDLVKTNFSRTILAEANLRGADLKGTRFFYGLPEKASPRSHTEPPKYETGEYTGAVIENADFTGAMQMSQEQRYYCCAWGGAKTRRTVPGGCEGIPNKLGR